MLHSEKSAQEKIDEANERREKDRELNKKALKLPFGWICPGEPAYCMQAGQRCVACEEARSADCWKVRIIGLSMDEELIDRIPNRGGNEEKGRFCNDCRRYFVEADQRNCGCPGRIPWRYTQRVLQD